MSYIIKSEVIFGHDEKEVINKFAHVLGDKFNGYKLSGFNIMSFDVPQLLFKFMKHNAIGGNYFPLKKWDVIDSRELLSFGDSRAKGTLEDYLQAFGLDGKYNGYNGSDCQRLYDEGKFDELEKYSLKDADVEMQLLVKTYDYLNHKERLDNILTFDIEVVCDEDKLPDLDVFRAKKLKELNEKYKQKSTIDKHMQSYEEELTTGEYKKDYIFNKFTNKVVAISYSWLEYEDVF